jgi:hypothetical protein
MAETPRHRIVSILLVALIACVATAGLLGCGSGGDTTDETTPDVGGFPPQFVTDEDIQAQEAGSPPRALLEWWQAFQFADPVGVIELTSKETLDEVGEKALADLVRTRGKGLQGIEIFGSTESGDVASVRAGLLSFQPEEPGDPPPDEPTNSSPTTFELADEGGDWKFNSPAYLEPMIEGLKASQEQADEQQDQSGGSGDEK